VTGGASGIGAATVELFAQEGARVVIADVRDDEGLELARRLGSAVRYQRTDVSREPDVAAAIGAAIAGFGRLDVLFNNAGVVGVLGPIAEIPLEGFDETLAVLLRGVFLGMKHAAPPMLAQRSGSIINTASVAGIRAGLGPHVYSAAKAAVIQLTRCVAMELGESGVRVNCICPGGIVTPLLTRELGGGEEAVRTVSGLLATFQPIARAGQPADVAQAALWLASDESSFVNAEALVVDGGLTGGRKWSEGLGATQSAQRLVETRQG
jgi:NAD(P)-dependent dehydrogenase (short-subunit alcohol dehydrogenase family)